MQFHSPNQYRWNRPNTRSAFTKGRLQLVEASLRGPVLVRMQFSLPVGTSPLPNHFLRHTGLSSSTRASTPVHQLFACFSFYVTLLDVPILWSHISAETQHYSLLHQRPFLSLALSLFKHETHTLLSSRAAQTSLFTFFWSRRTLFSCTLLALFARLLFSLSSHCRCTNRHFRFFAAPRRFFTSREAEAL